MVTVNRILRALEVETTLGNSFLRRDGFALATALVSVLVVGVALTGGFYSMFQTELQRRAAEGAGVLAQEALRAFARQASAEDLARIELGSDSLVTRVQIITGESMAGAFTVQVGHVEPSTYAIKSTGRLETPRGPVICSVDLRWSPAQPEDRLRVSPALQPVCNGQAPRSTILLRAHESES
jgi:hypothetical protein